MGNKFLLYDGWGLSQELINELNDIGAEIVFKIFDKKNGERKMLYFLVSGSKNWKDKGIRYFNRTLQEWQLILAEGCWEKKVYPSVREIR